MVHVTMLGEKGLSVVERITRHLVACILVASMDHGNGAPAVVIIIARPRSSSFLSFATH
jgi:hypothetical protein